MHKISIIIPVYNTNNFLTECIASISNQTHSDIEIICVDDCSTDDSYETLLSIAATEPRMVVLKNSANHGQGYSRNIGIQKATGSFIGFVDSDDIIDSTYYESLLSSILAINAEVASASIVYVTADESRIGDWARRTEPEKEVLSSEADRLQNIYANCNTSACKHLYRSDFLKKNDIKFLDGLYHEDQYFIARSFLLAERIACESKQSPKYYYQIRQGSSMHQDHLSPKYSKVFFDQLTVFKHILQLFTEHSVSAKTISVITKDMEHITLSSAKNIHETLLIMYVKKAKALFRTKNFQRKLFIIITLRTLKIEHEVAFIWRTIRRVKNFIWWNIKSKTVGGRVKSLIAKVRK